MINSYTEPQKLPMSGFWYILSVTLFKTLKSLIFPIIILFTSKRKNDFLLEAVAIIYPVFTLIAAFIKIYTFKYYILDQSLIIEFGLFKKEKINIPFKKITGIHIEEKLLHQPFHLALMRIETAGSNKTEGEIPSIQMQKALELKELILGYSIEGVEEKVIEKNPPLMQMNTREILRFGISDNHLLTSIWLLGIAWVYFWRLKEVMGDEWIDNIKDNYIFHWQTISVYVYVLLGILFISMIISIVKTFLKYNDFLLYKDPLSYQYTAGLIDKKNNVIPFRKVQFVRMKTNWWRKKWNIFTISLKQSQGGKNEKQNKNANAQFPVFEKAMYESILNTYYKDLSKDSVSQGIHQSYWIRLSLISGILIIVAVFTVAGLNKNLNLLWLLIPILTYEIIANILFVKKYKYFINEEALQIESGLWGRKVELIQWKNVQNIIVLQTLLQKRKNLANIKLITASGVITIPYISYKNAQNIQDHIVYITAQSSKSWT